MRLVKDNVLAGYRSNSEEVKKKKNPKVLITSASTDMTYWDSRTLYECLLLLLSKQGFSVLSKIPDLLFCLRGQRYFPAKAKLLNNCFCVIFELTCSKTFKASPALESDVFVRIICDILTYLHCGYSCPLSVFFPHVILG